ncbi:MAG TPA: nuclear transport factor 2 family protein [Rhizomicrobium sp.]|nr:nuclear transport factor 2 family protein [Rhizomicrobium sp.]
MHKLLLVLLLSAASFPVNAAVNCPRQPQSERGVLATEDLWVKALQTRDANLLDCILAPGFADMAWNGELHMRDEILAALPKRAANGIKLGKVTVIVSGNHAVARGVNTATKPDGSLLGRAKFEDTFVYRDGRWHALTAQEVLLR